MGIVNSPLRYPGGKAVLSSYLGGIIEVNELLDGVYAEPYAGGGGAALNLLFGEYVERIILNDIDPCVYAFWWAILRQTTGFLTRLEETPVSVEEWKKQRDIYRNRSRHSRIKVAFATFYLNRCNRSGIIVNGGPIGGHRQKGKWKLDARYNKAELIRRIEKIAAYRDRISIYNMDAVDFIKSVVLKSEALRETLVYLDPPYYIKGKRLYLNYYQHDDHTQLAKFMKKQKDIKWILSYDNVPEIRKLYSGMNQLPFNLRYSAHTAKVGSELLIYDNTITISEELKKLLGKKSDSLLVA